VTGDGPSGASGVSVHSIDVPAPHDGNQEELRRAAWQLDQCAEERRADVFSTAGTQIHFPRRSDCGCERRSTDTLWPRVFREIGSSQRPAIVRSRPPLGRDTESGADPGTAGGQPSSISPT
jgi:hypothetical protein